MPRISRLPAPTSASYLIVIKIEANSQIGGNAKKQVTLLLLLNLIIVDCLHDDFCCDHVTLPGVSDQKTTVA